MTSRRIYRSTLLSETLWMGGSRGMGNNKLTILLGKLFSFTDYNVQYSVQIVHTWKSSHPHPPPGMQRTYVDKVNRCHQVRKEIVSETDNISRYIHMMPYTKWFVIIIRAYENYNENVIWYILRRILLLHFAYTFKNITISIFMVLYHQLLIYLSLVYTSLELKWDVEINIVERKDFLLFFRFIRFLYIFFC